MGTRRTQKRERWTELFLKSLRKRGCISAAADAVGVPRRTVYKERERNPDFDQAVIEATECYVEDAEGELFTRAMDKDTTALIFFLKNRRPEVYADVPKGEQLAQIRLEARRELLLELQAEVAVLPVEAREAFQMALAGIKEPKALKS